MRYRLLVTENDGQFAPTCGAQIQFYGVAGLVLA